MVSNPRIESGDPVGHHRRREQKADPGDRADARLAHSEAFPHYQPQILGTEPRQVRHYVDAASVDVRDLEAGQGAGVVDLPDPGTGRTKGRPQRHIRVAVLPRNRAGPGSAPFRVPSPGNPSRWNTGGLLPWNGPGSASIVPLDSMENFPPSEQFQLRLILDSPTSMRLRVGTNPLEAPLGTIVGTNLRFRRDPSTENCPAAPRGSHWRGRAPSSDPRPGRASSARPPCRRNADAPRGRWWHPR